ncbi:hypothetical protein C8F04DRAFT_1190499 [Mycena alexandri]|uniref:Uncharacterized protein n=1 Tax=Mycena alexandri TaxID=1745969 RepID=A0AAD6WVP4_9AGAR|nr:hypothetical protein C8F04DRAFT_1190499 [Mycena alexandri]
MVRILFVTSPEAHTDSPSQLSSSYWTAEWVTHEQRTRFLTSETAGLYHQDWNGRDDFLRVGRPSGYFAFVVHETLSMAMRWSRRPQVELDVISFRNFSAIATLDDDGDKLAGYTRSYDIVYGGLEYTTDTVERHNMPNRRTEMLYIDRLDKLRHTVFVWPPPRQTLFYRHKLQLLNHLDLIAITVTKTRRPRSQMLEDPQQFTNLTARKADPHDIDAQHGLLWFYQDLVHPLRVHGELRVFTVAEKIVSIVGTTPTQLGDDSWFVKDASAVYGLDELADAIEANADPHDVLVRRGDSVHQRQKAMEALHKFVLQTLSALIERAESLFHEPSVMRDFARIDVSFMKKENGEDGFDYFVNEVEIGCDVNLFSPQSDFAEAVMDEILNAIVARYTKGLQVQAPAPSQPLSPPPSPPPPAKRMKLSAPRKPRTLLWPTARYPQCELNGENGLLCL